MRSTNMPRYGAIFLRALCAVFLSASTCTQAGPTLSPHKPHVRTSGYAARNDVRAYIDQMARQHGFDRRKLSKLFAQVKTQPSALRAMSAPIEQPPKWYEYSASLLSDTRVERGLDFWRDNEPALVEAESEFGVPPEIVVAIIGVETFYGRVSGRYRVIDTLTTLAFDYPRRAEFFRKELTDFLLLCREQHLSALEPRGSFAGAMGLPQFMPGTFRDYAIDFDQDGRIDIWHDASDSVGSVANFLLWHGWQRHEPVLLPAQVDNAEVLRLLNGGISDRRALHEWEQDGVRVGEGLPESGAADSPAALVMLEQPAVSSYWLGFNNFYVLTRYNRSRLYAAAVWQLAEKIRAAHESGKGAGSVEH